MPEFASCSRCQQARPAVGDAEGLCPGCRSTTGAGATTVDRPGGPGLPDDAPEALESFGDYELLGEVARGGMGVVYRARQRGLGRVVGLKMMAEGRFGSAEDVRRFRLEAEVVAQLDHPHIVPIYEVGLHQGRHYFSMKFAEGGSLSGRVQELLDRPREVARMMARIAGAVDHAHRRGLLHRDLKPANILIDERGEPLVSDFGLARRAEVGGGITLSGAILGSPSYMAPEQAGGRAGAITTAADVYGLGAILYELLSGRPPFRADSPLETLRQVRERDPASPRSIRPRADAELSWIALKCLEKEPGRRYRSAAALASDLDRWLDGRPIEARPATAWALAAKWARRRPAIAALLLAMAAGSAAGLGGILWQWRRARAALGESIEARGRVDSLRVEASRLAAGLALDRGQDRLEAGFTGRALLETARALRLAPASEAHLGWLIRVNLADQLRQVRPLSRSEAHDGPVRVVELSPSGATAITADDRSARIWEVASGRTLGSIATPGGRVAIARFSPDGRSILTAEPEGLRLRDASDGRLLGPTFGHPGPVSAVRFSPDGRVVLTGSDDGSACAWDAATGWPLGPMRPHPQPILEVSARPDGPGFLTFCKDGVVRRWAFEGGGPEVLSSQAGGMLRAAASPVGDVALIVDAARVPRLFDIATGRPVAAVAEAAGSRIARFSPDGRWLAMDLGDRVVGLWEVSSLGAAGRPIEHLGRVLDAAPGPGGRVVLTGSSDGAARAWAAAEGDEGVRALEHPGALFGLAASPDGRRAWTCGVGGAKLWDLGADPPRLLASAGEAATAVVAFSPGGRAALAGDAKGAMRFWDPTSGSAAHPPIVQGGALLAAAFSPDGRLALTSCGDPAAPLRLWDVATGRPVGPPWATVGQVTKLAFSPDGRLALACSGGVAIHRVPGGEAAGPTIREPGRKGVAYASAFSPDGRSILAALGGEAAQLWDASTGRPIGPPIRHPDVVSDAAFSPDGRTILTGCFDGSARLWDAATGRPVGGPMDHRSPVRSVAFDPSGRLILAGCFDGSARLWDAATGRPIGLPLAHGGPIVGLGFGPLGRSTISAGGRSALIRPVPAPAPGPIPALIREAQAKTGMQLDADGNPRTLDPDDRPDPAPPQ